jgi:hypothetical protein
MDPSEFVVKPTDMFLEKCTDTRKIYIVVFIEANKHFWSLEAINYLVFYIQY